MKACDFCSEVLYYSGGGRGSFEECVFVAAAARSVCVGVCVCVGFCVWKRFRDVTR